MVWDYLSADYGEIDVTVSKLDKERRANRKLVKNQIDLFDCKRIGVFPDDICDLLHDKLQENPIFELT